MLGLELELLWKQLSEASRGKQLGKDHFLKK